MRSLRWIQGYYLASPLFFLLGFYRAQDAIAARLPWLVIGQRRGPGSG